MVWYYLTAELYLWGKGAIKENMMRKGVKIGIAILIIVLLGMVFVPAIITAFVGGHP